MNYDYPMLTKKKPSSFIFCVTYGNCSQKMVTFKRQRYDYGDSSLGVDDEKQNNNLVVDRKFP